MELFNDIEFASKGYFWLFLSFIPLIAWYIFGRKFQNPEMKLSTIEPYKSVAASPRIWLRHTPFIFSIIALSLFIIALARPQSYKSSRDISVEGIDIVISLDISGSMLAEDFKPNRIEAAKDIAKEFIDKRPQDRIGLVIFSGESFTQCPLTTDHTVLKNLFSEVHSGMIDDGTAIGMGLATSVNRLRFSTAKSKVIILLTDGVNNMGAVAPLTAAEIAKQFGIRVYTIGVGKMGTAPYPFQTPFGKKYQQIEVEIDEPLMQHISDITGGIYRRATDEGALREILDEIDQMEKTKINVTEFRKPQEKFHPYVLWGVVLIICSFLLRYTVFKTLP